MEKNPFGKPTILEAPMGLYFLIQMGSPLEIGGSSVIIKAIDLSDHPRQIRIPKTDWEIIKNAIDVEFGLALEVDEQEIKGEEDDT